MFTPQGTQYNLRLKEIRERIKKYVNNFRDNPLYDFYTPSPGVQKAQEELNKAIDAYARGFFEVEEVKIKAKGYVEAHKREEVTPPSKAGSKIPRDTHPFFYLLPLLIKERQKYYRFMGEAPPRGKPYIIVENGEAFDAKGKPIDNHTAEMLIQKELDVKFADLLNLRLEVKYKPERRVTKSKTEDPEPEPKASSEEAINPGGKTLQEIKKEMETKKQKAADIARQEKLTKSLRRARKIK